MHHCIQSKLYQLSITRLEEVDWLQLSTQYYDNFPQVSNDEEAKYERREKAGVLRGGTDYQYNPHMMASMQRNNMSGSAVFENAYSTIYILYLCCIFQLYMWSQIHILHAPPHATKSLKSVLYAWGNNWKLVNIDQSVLLEPLTDSWMGEIALAAVRQECRGDKNL